MKDGSIKHMRFGHTENEIFRFNLLLNKGTIKDYEVV